MCSIDCAAPTATRPVCGCGLDLVAGERLCPQCAAIAKALRELPQARERVAKFNDRQARQRLIQWNHLQGQIRPRYRNCKFSSFDVIHNLAAAKACRDYARAYVGPRDVADFELWDDFDEALGLYPFDVWPGPGDRLEDVADRIDGVTTTGLMLMGPVGTGKTHLSVSIMYRARTGVLVSAVELLGEIMDSYRTRAGCPRLDMAREAELLVLDDLGAEATGDWATREIFELIGYRYEMQMPLIVTTNCTLGVLGKRLGARTASRLGEMCEVVQLSGPDYRLKARKGAGGRN